MPLESFDKLMCNTLDDKDIRFVEETFAKLQYAKDLAQLEASKKHLESTIAAKEKANRGVVMTQTRANRAGLGARYHAISSKRLDVFTKTPFYLLTLPYVTSCIDASRRSEALRIRQASGIASGVGQK
jgi:hypothetical protein